MLSRMLICSGKGPAYTAQSDPPLAPVTAIGAARHHSSLTLHTCCPAVAIAMGDNVNPTVPNKEWYQRPSLLSFGPWGPTSNCKQLCGTASDGSYSCKPTSKWPYGMCTLKVLKDAAKPEYYNQNAGGWCYRVLCQQACASVAIVALEFATMMSS